MEITLTSEQKRLLELEHRYESDARICDRIKAVLLKSENWTDKAIAQALRIHEETVRRHLSDWINKKKIRPENGGSESKLNHVQTDALERHLEGNVYSKVIEICAYVENTFQVHYPISGMTKWLKQHNFRYKKPKGIPAKADKAFVEAYLQLVEEISSNEPVIFIDATHPTMATKISYGWIKKGVDKPIAQTAAKTRVNVMGGIELASMKVVTKYPEFVNTESTIQFLRELKMAYPEAPKLHIILDQSSYHRSQAVQDFSKLEAIELHYLPSYSPNLNPIERLWKVMNEQVRNNRFFKSAKEFRESIVRFFNETIPFISSSLRYRINDNFQIINSTSSS